MGNKKFSRERLREPALSRKHLNVRRRHPRHTFWQRRTNVWRRVTSPRRGAKRNVGRFHGYVSWRAVATTRPRASPQHRRRDRTRRAVATTRPRASRQHHQNLTRRAVATTRPRASLQRRRRNRTSAVAMTAPNPNRVPPAILQSTGAGELRQSWREGRLSPTWWVTPQGGRPNAAS
jgi:hypothetical protein